MFILSQNREYLAKLNTAYAIGDKVIVNDDTFGRYCTDKQAEKVIEDMAICLEKGNVLYRLPDWRTIENDSGYDPRKNG